MVTNMNALQCPKRHCDVIVHRRHGIEYLFIGLNADSEIVIISILLRRYGMQNILDQFEYSS